MQDLESSEKIGLLKLVLDRMSWKLVAQLAVIGVLCGVGYFVWEVRWKVFSEGVSRWARPEINDHRLPAVVDGLAGELRPTTIFVWAANVSNDTKRPIYAWVNGTRRPELEGRTEPLFPDNPAGMQQVVQLIRGEDICAEHNRMARHRPIIREAGIVWGCAIGIPPGAGVVGAITIGFTENRTDEYNYIRSSLIRWSRYATVGGV